MENNTKSQDLLIEALFKVFYVLLFILFAVEIGWSQEVSIWTMLISALVVVLIFYPAKAIFIEKTWGVKLLIYISIITKLFVDKMTAGDYFNITDLDTLAIAFIFIPIYYDYLKIKRLKVNK